MSDLVNRIKQRLPNECLRNGKLIKEGCYVPLKNAPTPSIKIDMDKTQAPGSQNQTKCDYIFIGGCDDVFLAPLELTKQDFDTSKAVRQLQAGARVAARIIPAGEQVKFYPVAVCGGRVRRDQKLELRQRANKILFKNKLSIVRVLNCGEPLIRAFSQDG